VIAPPRWLEAVVGVSLPRSRREDVLGDLYERYTSPVRYVCDALQVVPVIALSHAVRHLRRASASRLIAEGRAVSPRRGLSVLVPWCVAPRPVLLIGGWHLLLSVVGALGRLRGVRHVTEPGAE